MVYMGPLTIIGAQAPPPSPTRCTIMVSADGVGWQKRSNPWDSLLQSSQWYGSFGTTPTISYGGGNLLACSYYTPPGSSVPVPNILRSVDTILWDQLTVVTEGSYEGAAFCPIGKPAWSPSLELWVCGGACYIHPSSLVTLHGMATSGDGATWNFTQSPSDASANLYPQVVVWNSVAEVVIPTGTAGYVGPTGTFTGAFFAGGNSDGELGQTICMSVDGVNWLGASGPVSTSGPNVWRGVPFGAQTLMGGGNSRIDTRGWIVDIANGLTYPYGGPSSDSLPKSTQQQITGLATDGSNLGATCYEFNPPSSTWSAVLQRVGTTWEQAATTPWDFYSVSGAYNYGPADMAYSPDLDQWLVVGMNPLNYDHAVMTAPSLTGTWTEQTTPMDNAPSYSSTPPDIYTAEPGALGAIWAHTQGMWVVVGSAGPMPT